MFDIDYMDEMKDFTYDKDRYDGFPEMIDQLHNENIKVVLITVGLFFILMFFVNKVLEILNIAFYS